MTFVLLHNSAGSGPSYLFTDPDGIVETSDPAGVEACLETLKQAGIDGLHAAGYFSYELGLCFEPKLRPLLKRGLNGPLLWFGLFSERRQLDAAAADAWITAHKPGPYTLDGISPTLSPAEYERKIHRALGYIGSGDIYQLNFTMKAKFAFSGDPLGLYRDLRRKQRVPYGAVISSPDFHLLSLSPELFLSVKDGVAYTRPMKGTVRRGVHLGEDDQLGHWIANDIKSRAENLMIVDLMRNDLARISEMGSVEVSDLFTVETYQTVLQMTSGVTARLRSDVDFPALVRAVYPPGSITGAPKIRAMEIIGELEAEPRGVYTGTIGMIEPSGDCVFNVAIRTVVLDNDGRGEIGIGSGIVQDSVPASEYDECLLKMRFLTAPVPDFKLIETLKWDRNGGFVLLPQHLDRLSKSARYFGFPYNADTVIRALDGHVAHAADSVLRVRLTLDEQGAVDVASIALAAGSAPAWRFALAETRMHTANVFLYHKTTRRDFYDNERERLNAKHGCQEVLFMNERGELTEGSFTSLFLEKNGTLYTPALSCGLLPGTLRADLLARGKARETVLTLRDLADAEAIWLGNSVRGLIRAVPSDAFLIQASAVKRLESRPSAMTAYYSADSREFNWR